MQRTEKLWYAFWALVGVAFASSALAGTRDIKEDTAATYIVGPFVDTSGAAVTAPTIASIDITAYKNDGTAVTITPAASGTSNDMVHVDDGYFSLELTTTDTSTPGYLRLSFQISGALIFHEDFNVLPANIFDSKYGSDKLQVDVVQFINSTFVEDSTANIAQNFATFFNNDDDKSGNEPILNDVGTLSATPLAGLVDAVWDEATSGHTTAGTAGKKLIDNLASTVSGRTLDVSAGGEAGLDWANVGSPTTTVALSGTTVGVTTTVTNPVKLPNEWYVSTTGSDANAGTSKAAPLLTIAAAYTAASPGDVINLAEGTWSGANSLTKNGITLRGASRTGTILTHNSGFTLNVATISARIERMTINATAETSSGTGLGLNGCYDVVVRDCTINGKFDGCSGTTAKNLRFYDCEINGTFDGLNLSRSSNCYLEDCHISSSADYSTDNAFRAFYAGESTTTVTSQITTGRAVGCTFSIVRTGTSALNQNTSAAEVAGHWKFADCKFLARASNASYGGIVYGLTEPSETVGGVNLNAPSHVKMDGCTYNTSNAGSAGVFDAAQRRTNSDMAIDGGHYTAAKVSGAAMRDSSPSAAMVNTAVEAGVAGTNAATAATQATTAATQSTAANTAIGDLPTAAENAAAVIAETAAGAAGTVGKILADYAAVKPATTIAAADDVEEAILPLSENGLLNFQTFYNNGDAVSAKTINNVTAPKNITITVPQP